MNTPQVSVVVPVYNGAAYLRETLDALLAQSFQDFELLAIDDGSKDNSAEIIRSLNDPRVRLIQKPNGGLCDALNRGIAEARAPWIARNDQDDISTPDRLARQMAVIRDHPEAICLFTYNTKFGGRHRWANTDKLPMNAGEVTIYDPLKDGCLLGSTMLVQTEAIRAVGGFRQAYYPVDDWDLETRLHQAGTVLVLREPLVAYRFHTSANTYRVFVEMQHKSRWTIDSFDRRKQGLPELSFPEFMATERRDAWWRVDQYRLNSARLHMRVAGQDYLDGRYVTAAARLSAATLLNPGNVYRRVKRMLRRPPATSPST